jgi:hypothetical protein
MVDFYVSTKGTLTSFGSQTKIYTNKNVSQQKKGNSLLLRTKEKKHLLFASQTFYTQGRGLDKKRKFYFPTHK